MKMLILRHSFLTIVVSIEATQGHRRREDDVSISEVNNLIPFIQ